MARLRGSSNRVDGQDGWRAEAKSTRNRNW